MLKTEPIYMETSSTTTQTAVQEEDAYYVEVQSPTKNGSVLQPRIHVETELLNRTARPSVSSPIEDYEPVRIQTKNDDNYYSTCTPRSQSLEDLADEGAGEQSNRRMPRTSVSNAMGYVPVEENGVTEEETYYVTPHSHSCSVSSLQNRIEESGEYQNIEKSVTYLQLVADTTASGSLPNSSGSNFLSTSPNSRPLKSTRSTSSPMLPPPFSNNSRSPTKASSRFALSTSSLPKKDRSVSVSSPMSPPTLVKIFASDQDMNIYENSVHVELEENIYDN